MGNEQAIVVDREPVVHRITVEEFLALDEGGFFENVGRVELIDGEIFEMAPLHRPHTRALIHLTVAVSNAVDQVAGIEAFSPVSAELDRHSLPEADIVVATRVSDEEERFVTSATVRLLVEVSASSLRHDLGRKLRLYARTGVPEYWVADVAGRKIIRFHAPEGETYRERVEFDFGATIASATIAGLVVDTIRLG
jgi:Uma2 family endonuclease